MYIESRNRPIYIARPSNGTRMYTLSVLMLLAGIFWGIYWFFVKDWYNEYLPTIVEVEILGEERMMGEGTYIMLGMTPTVLLIVGGIIASCMADAIKGTYLMIYNGGICGCVLQGGNSMRKKYFDFPIREITNCVWNNKSITIQRNAETYTMRLMQRDIQWILQYLSCRNY